MVSTWDIRSEGPGGLRPGLCYRTDKKRLAPHSDLWPIFMHHSGVQMDQVADKTLTKSKTLKKG